MKLNILPWHICNSAFTNYSSTPSFLTAHLFSSLFKCLFKLVNQARNIFQATT